MDKKYLKKLNLPFRLYMEFFWWWWTLDHTINVTSLSHKNGWNNFECYDLYIHYPFRKNADSSHLISLISSLYSNCSHCSVDLTLRPVSIQSVKKYFLNKKTSTLWCYERNSPTKHFNF